MKFIKAIIFCSFYFICFVLITFTIVWLYIGKDFPETEYLKDYIPPSMTRIYDRNGEIIQELGSEKRVFVQIDQIPPLLIYAFLSAEDKNFLNHSGIDVLRLITTIFVNTLNGDWNKSPKGASTITQQLTKNFLVGNERSFIRKLKEAVLSLRIEKELSKKRILELYLNHIYLGRGCYGVVASALNYFGKRLDQLIPAECAFLASCAKSPGVLKKSVTRRNWILRKMMENGFLKEKDLNINLKQNLSMKKETSFHQDYFTEEVKRLLSRNHLNLDLGWSIFTTLDPLLQSIAEKSLQIGLENFEETLEYKKANFIPTFLESGIVIQKVNSKLLIRNKDKEFWTSSNNWYEFVNVGDAVLLRNNKIVQIPSATGGIVVLDADNGEVLALSGGYDYKMQNFNCATQASRQIGSIFKPFVYLTAFNNGYRPESTIMDAPIEVYLGQGLGYYRPKNITGISYGITPLHVGLTHSRNLVTVRLAQNIGMKKIRDTAFLFKVTDKMPLQLAMSLGACDTTLLKICASYARMINGGFDIEPHFIKRELPLNAIDGFTNNIPRVSFNFLKNSSQNWHNVSYPKIIDSRRRLINPDLSILMKKLLEKAVEVGTAKKISYLQKSFNLKIGGKTGTTNECKDAWFIGFVTTPKGKTYIIGVFVGFLTPKSLGEKSTGSKVAMPIFEDFIKNSYTYLLNN